MWIIKSVINNIIQQPTTDYYESASSFSPARLIFQKFNCEKNSYFSNLYKFCAVTIKDILFEFVSKNYVDFPKYSDISF